MKRYLKNLVALLLAFVLVFTTYIPSVAYGTPVSSNQGERDEVATELSSDALAYYTGSYTYDKLDDMSASSLQSALKTLMTTTHKYTSNYDNCRDWAKYTDCENGDGRVLLIYTSYSATMSQWNGWNREHVWPKSKGGNNTTGGGADLHHIRPSDAVVNSTRGNKSYGYANGGKATYGNNPATGVLGGYSGTYYEPLDNVKGDVARIVLYVWVRWGSAWGAESVTEVFQSVDVLLEWCALDPVDTWEMGRNDVVEDIQGNRNVFIDYPELAWLVFDREIPSNMKTPSGEASNGNGGSQDGGDSTCSHTNTAIKNVKAATCAEEGYTGDTYCVACSVVTVKGQTVPVTNTHSFSDWVLNESDNTRVRICSVCKKTESYAFSSPEELLSYAGSDTDILLILMILGYNEKMFVEELSK